MRKNIILNIFGVLGPLCVGFILIPLIISQLGTTKFGILSIAWAIVGYFSIFDLGLGRALTQALAQSLGSGNHGQIMPLVTKSAKIMCWLSAGAAATMWLLAPFVADAIVDAGSPLRSDTVSTFQVLAVGMPAVIFFNALRGALEAFDRFAELAFIRLLLGVWTFLSPCLALQFDSSLTNVVIYLVAGRYFVLIFLFIKVKKEVLRYHGLRGTGSEVLVKHILSSGGWMTISNLVSPIMAYTDRFFVAALGGASVIAYYTTPYDLIARLSFIPEAAFGVIFPRIAKKHGENSGDLNFFLDQIFIIAALIGFFSTSVIIIMSRKFFDWWLGSDFSENSSDILIILSVGFFFNLCARPFYNFLQGTGNSKLTAIIHLIELPFYLLGIFYMITYFGVIGAAFCWTFRNGIDFLMLGTMANRHRIKRYVLKVQMPVFLSLAFFALVYFMGDINYQILALLLCFVLFCALEVRCAFFSRNYLAQD